MRATKSGPQTPYETKPHMKQHCCCTRQGHPWLAISTVVAAENPRKDDAVSCRVCFVSGEIADPKQMKDGQAVVSRWVCAFMLDLEQIVWCFSMLFHVGVYVCDALGIEIHCLKTAEHQKFCCILGHDVD